MRSTRVLVADDHPGLATAIGQYVAEAFDFVGMARDGGALLEAAEMLRPDVIVSDISMPGLDGLTAMTQIQRHLPQVKVILLTNYGDADIVRHALHVGASGFVLKIYAPTELVPAIRTVMKGGTYVSRAIAV